MKPATAGHDDLARFVADLPIVDCHEHMKTRERITDILVFLCSQYYSHDLASAVGDAAVTRIMDASLPLAERWPDFERAYRATRFTGYGVSVRMAMRKLFGIEEPTLEALDRAQGAIPDYSDPATFDGILAEAGIVARISDCWPLLKEIVTGSHKRLSNQFVAFSLPAMHGIHCRADLAPLEAALGTTVTSLDEYVALCRRAVEAGREYGAVCLKDQSAYNRSIAYRMPPRADAERVFNRMIGDPRYRAEYDPSDNALSDYLMHELMRIARDVDLPVQLHTGHMAGVRNDVAKANAAGLRSLLEVHRDVRFDLFHSNWPYSGDILFLAKNYPNVTIDFCWTHIIDPVYARTMLVQSVSAVPYTKIHGFGSDVMGGLPHIAWAHAELARQVITAALADLTDMDYISADDARQIAVAWLYDNPRRFFRLDLPEDPTKAGFPGPR